MHPSSTYLHKRYHYIWLNAGSLTAHGRFCLPLLPSGPDGVHKFPLRETHISTPPIMGSPHRNKPRTGIRSCYSGLQVQGTATSPSSMVKYWLNSTVGLLKQI